MEVVYSLEESVMRVNLEVQGYEFSTDFKVIPLRGYDMVLGVQWLLALRNIIWNFGSLTMQLLVKGEPCTINRIVSGFIAIGDISQPSKCFAAVG